LIETSSKIRTGFKYVYLVAFFALLAGFFHPLITGDSFDSVIFGVFVLFVGLAGGILLYKSATSEKRREIYFGGGFVIIGISLTMIFLITGRA
jgi:peptidoglycan/LPS O-acetylase OafA/YrhL